MYQLTCSIVLYNNDPEELKGVINCVLSGGLNVHLFLIDNSQTDKLKSVVNEHCSEKVSYIFNKRNIGYGKGHNVALRICQKKAPYHLVLNPDVSFKKNVLPELLEYIASDASIGQVMPKVFYDDNNIQKLCNLLPTPADLIGRRFLLKFKYVQNLNRKYELEGFDYNSAANIPNLSGCFMLLRQSALKKTGLFDERYFMYMEDVDLTRRIHKEFKTMYYPYVNITHRFKKESYYNLSLLLYHTLSAIKYFNKWGWFFDRERKKINLKTLELLQQLNKNHNNDSQNVMSSVLPVKP